MSMREREAAASKAKKAHGRLETSLTSSNSFNIHFAILLMLRCTWPTVPKAMTTNTNTHVAVQKVIEMCVRPGHNKYIHLSWMDNMHGWT